MIKPVTEPYIDPGRRFAIATRPRTVELWTVQPIRFDRRERPTWQQRPGGAIARLHDALRVMRPQSGDVLAATFSDPDLARPDVENRLFTNTKEPPDDAPKGTPNPFTNLPRSVAFERRFDVVAPPEPLVASPVHYRYALTADASWSEWHQVSGSLATWNQVAITRLSDGAGWPIWLGMARPGADVRITHKAPPLTENFAIELTIHTGRPLQMVTVMEAIVDGVIASFQREPDPVRAQRVVEVLRRKPLLRQFPAATLLAAQLDAPAVLDGPPWAINDKGTWAQLAPADRWVVAGRVAVAVETGRVTQALSGRLLRVSH